jgi:LCP family protein required for cell wall assembly
VDRLAGPGEVSAGLRPVFASTISHEETHVILMAQRSPRESQFIRKPRRGRAGRIFGVIALLSLGSLAAGAGYLYHKYSVLGKYGGSLVSGLTTPPSKAFPETPHAMNLMVIGRDYDYTNSDQIINSQARSDVLMVAHLDFDKQTVSLLSIPRDTETEVPEGAYGTFRTKINAAHEFGGPQESEQVVENTFGIRSDHYVDLDPQGFDEAINVLGGVNLVVDRKMDYDDNWGHLHIHLLPGSQHLDGTQAMGFVRFRHADSDLMRIQRQQTLLAALKAELLQPQTLPKIPLLLETIDKRVHTDLTPTQQIVLASFLHSTPRSGISMATVPSMDGRGTLQVTDWARATPMVQSIFGVTPPQSSIADAGYGEQRSHRRRHRRHYSVASLP